MKNDKVLTHTSRGRFILELFDHLIKSNEELKSQIAAGKAGVMLTCGRRAIYSDVADKMWSMFHKLRLSEDNQSRDSLDQGHKIQPVALYFFGTLVHPSLSSHQTAA
jgi:hypothetical protein